MKLLRYNVIKPLVTENKAIAISIEITTLNRHHVIW
uniref:Uncharacterized protein n=1 Tax=Siphoviridae sp. ctNs77 TaxID=2825473 RepID=A0A8S5QI58_9CAUD|nr:MAG TPA: hypothetical protein [Siphoviridae sp. ctNs77]DAI04192.1 MAG TPA: hypothetical protein [Caudoviricetes sp.]DAJ30523.1 MAG TPA: hypothetical protein [Caudoviricetes sp.]